MPSAEAADAILVVVKVPGIGRFQTPPAPGPSQGDGGRPAVVRGGVEEPAAADASAAAASASAWRQDVDGLDGGRLALSEQRVVRR